MTGAARQRFLTGSVLDDAIRRVTSAAKVDCAVAFWGRGAENLFAASDRQQIRIVCNLKSGGTNPTVIEKLKKRPGLELRQADDLHAKVYIGDRTAIVTSANASANGLGFEGIEQTRWQEAGIVADASDDVLGWFEDLFARSRPVGEDDLGRAKKLWQERRGSKPSLLSFTDFDLTASPLPLVTWWWLNKEPYTIYSKSVSDQIGFSGPTAEARIDASLEIDRNDKDVLRSNSWILCWKRKFNGYPSCEMLYWFRVGPVICDAYAYDSSPKESVSIVIPADTRGPEPFDVQEEGFRNAFDRVIAQREFAPLRDFVEQGAWFTRERLELTRSFWSAVKAVYGASPRS